MCSLVSVQLRRDIHNCFLIRSSEKGRFIHFYALGQNLFYALGQNIFCAVGLKIFCTLGQRSATADLSRIDFDYVRSYHCMLYAKTVNGRAVKMSSNITNQQTEDLKLVSASSIALDESWDINETVQLSLFVRFISSTAPEKEILGLLPLKGQTCGENIAYAVIE
ncbi:hypothetical protein AVEN_62873-1 [Araneus ventricosus]|uniref:Uncharacterized protein n=1 Tax=Araneus ventricosus TaxID=182803 RepID=A0A4Y2J747_ARAVE|nr:hypothetical protein AVEN_62873-1 [Araneus ventricosus]